MTYFKDLCWPVSSIGGNRNQFVTIEGLPILSIGQGKLFGTIDSSPLEEKIKLAAFAKRTLPLGSLCTSGEPVTILKLSADWVTSEDFSVDQILKEICDQNEKVARVSSCGAVCDALWSWCCSKKTWQWVSFASDIDCHRAHLVLIFPTSLMIVLILHFR